MQFKHAIFLLGKVALLRDALVHRTDEPFNCNIILVRRGRLRNICNSLLNIRMYIFTHIYTYIYSQEYD